MEPIRTSATSQVYKLDKKQRTLFLNSLPEKYVVEPGPPMAIYRKGTTPADAYVAGFSRPHLVEYQPVARIYRGVVIVDRDSVVTATDLASVLEHLEELQQQSDEKSRGQKKLAV